MSLASYRHAPLLRFWSERSLLDIAPPVDDLIDRLGAWLDVRQAIALHQQLGAETGRDHNRRTKPVEARIGLEQVEQTLSQLRDAIDHDRVSPGLWRNPMPERLNKRPAPWAELWEPYRRYMVDHQKQMALVLSRLRRQLRDELSRRHGDGATLAQIDAAFEHAIAPRESKWLAIFPFKMERHLSNLLAKAGPDPSDASMVLQVFEQDLRLSLRYELDLRAQPLLGLAETLHHIPS